MPPEDTVPESGPNGTQNVPANDASNLAQAPPISDSVGQAIVDAAGGFTDSVTEATDATQNFSSGVESASDASAEAWERLRQLSQATAQLGASFKAATAGTVEYWQGVSGFLQQMRALYVQYGFQPPAYQTAMGPISRSTPPSGNEPYPVMKPGADLANMSVEERRAWFKAHGYEDWQIDWRGMGHPAGSGGTPVSRSVPQSGNQPYPVMHPGVDLSRMSIEERQAYFRSKGYQDWQIDWRGMGHPAGSGIDAAAYRRSLMPAAPSADEQLRNRQDPMEWDWLFRANNAMALYSGGQISWEEYQSRVRLPNVAVPNMGASPTGPQDFTIHVEPDGTIIGAITKKVLEQFTAQLRQKGLVA